MHFQNETAARVYTDTIVMEEISGPDPNVLGKPILGATGGDRQYDAFCNRVEIRMQNDGLGRRFKIEGLFRFKHKGGTVYQFSAALGEKVFEYATSSVGEA